MSVTELVVKPSVLYGNFQKTSFQVISDSKEGKKIGRGLLDYCMKKLSSEGYIEQGAVIERTYALDFENKHRNSLMLNLLEVKENQNTYIKFKDMIDCNIIINPEVGDEHLPEDIESIKDKVEKFAYSGHSLHEMPYVKDKKYTDALSFIQIVAEFSFKVDDLHGKFEVSYGFPDYSIGKKSKSEFEFRINDIHPYIDENISAQKRQELELFLREEFANIKDKVIEAIPRKHGRQLSFM